MPMQIATNKFNTENARNGAQLRAHPHPSIPQTPSYPPTATFNITRISTLFALAPIQNADTNANTKCQYQLPLNANRNCQYSMPPHIANSKCH